MNTRTVFEVGSMASPIFLGLAIIGSLLTFDPIIIGTGIFFLILTVLFALCNDW